MKRYWMLVMLAIVAGFIGCGGSEEVADDDGWAKVREEAENQEGDEDLPEGLTSVNGVVMPTEVYEDMLVEARGSDYMLEHLFIEYQESQRK